MRTRHAGQRFPSRISSHRRVTKGVLVLQPCILILPPLPAATTTTANPLTTPLRSGRSFLIVPANAFCFVSFSGILVSYVYFLSFPLVSCFCRRTTIFPVRSTRLPRASSSRMGSILPWPTTSRICSQGETGPFSDANNREKFIVTLQAEAIRFVRQYSFLQAECTQGTLFRQSARRATIGCRMGRWDDTSLAIHVARVPEPRRDLEPRREATSMDGQINIFSTPSDIFSSPTRYPRW